MIDDRWLMVDGWWLMVDGWWARGKGKLVSNFWTSRDFAGWFLAQETAGDSGGNFSGMISGKRGDRSMLLRCLEVSQVMVVPSNHRFSGRIFHSQPLWGPFMLGPWKTHVWTLGTFPIWSACVLLDELNLWRMISEITAMLSIITCCHPFQRLHICIFEWKTFLSVVAKVWIH